MLTAVLLVFDSFPPHQPASAAATAAPSSSPVKTAAQSPAPAAATLQDGSRVRIEGLQAKPQHNGRTGAICGGLDQESGRWTVAVDASDACPAFQISVRPANLTPLPAIDIDALQRPSTSSASSTKCNPPAKALHDGSRARVEGLQAKPHMNGRTGVVCGAFDQETGRWTVDLVADGARPACRGTFRAANLRLIPSHNFSTEWVDEGGRAWPKNVDFSRQCAKGHALAPLGERGGRADRRLMCRLCHCFCERSCDEASRWLMCSEDAGCCGEYAVCCSCAQLPSVAAAACAGSDDFCTQVSCRVALFVRGVTWLIAGRGGAVPVLAAVDGGLLAGPHDHVAVLPAVCAAVHVVQPRQRDGAADGAG
jgi:hypothetical protein